MTQDYVLHEWFYPGGPETHEYALSAARIRDDHRELIPPWLHAFHGLEVGTAKARLDAYFTSIQSPALNPLLTVMDALLPYSFVLQEHHAWLLLKHPSELEAPSAHGNMLMIPPPHEKLPQFLYDEFSLSQQPELKMLIQHFAGLRMDIPPVSGMLWPNEFFLATNEQLPNVASWENSLSLFHYGDGNVVLVNAAGLCGRWDHEMTDNRFVERMVAVHGMKKPHDGAVFLIGTVSELVQHIAAETGIGA